MKQKKYKPPSFVRQLVDLQIERYKTHKALRQLVNNEWSVEFLTAMLVRASNITHQPLEMTITNKAGTSIKVNTVDTPNTAAYNDDSIFNHLDDELKVRQFVESMNKR